MKPKDDVFTDLSSGDYTDMEEAVGNKNNKQLKAKNLRVLPVNSNAPESDEFD